MPCAHIGDVSMSVVDERPAFVAHTLADERPAFVAHTLVERDQSEGLECASWR